MYIFSKLLVRNRRMTGFMVPQMHKYTVKTIRMKKIPPTQIIMFSIVAAKKLLKPPPRLIHYQVGWIVFFLGALLLLVY